MSEVVGQVAIETPEGTVSQIVDGKTIVGVNDVAAPDRMAASSCRWGTACPFALMSPPR